MGARLGWVPVSADGWVHLGRRELGEHARGGERVLQQPGVAVHLGQPDRFAFDWVDVDFDDAPREEAA